jgi:hypothetical protein
MRRELFDYITPSAPPPRLQPNVFARVARFSFRYAGFILLLWTMITTAFLAAGLLSPNPLPFKQLAFTSSTPASENLAALNHHFPNIDAMLTLTIANSDPGRLKLAQINLVAALEARKDLFDLVFAPGSGEYYDTHAMLYHATDEVKARVAYAKSLHPLFAALAEAPSTESLATLVSGVSAAIELGRDPQGLDALFVESGKAVQALMEGNNYPVDWTKVAGLNIDAQPKSTMVFAIPKPGANAKALDEISAVLKALKKSGGTVSSLNQATHGIAAEKPVAPLPRQYAAFAIAAVFIIFTLVALLGQFSLATMVFVPVLVTTTMSFGALRLGWPAEFAQLWPLLLGTGISALQLSTRLSFAALEALSISRSRSDARLPKAGQGHAVAMPDHDWRLGQLAIDR